MKILLASILTFAFILASCDSKNNKKSTDDFLDKFPEPLLAETHEVTTPEMLEELQMAFGFTELQSFALFMDNDVIQCDFYFSPSVTAGQIDSACSFGYERMHVLKTTKYDQRLFDVWLFENFLVDEKLIQETYIRIFVDNSLKLVIHYFDGVQINLFEAD